MTLCAAFVIKGFINQDCGFWHAFPQCCICGMFPMLCESSSEGTERLKAQMPFSCISSIPHSLPILSPAIKETVQKCEFVSGKATDRHWFEGLKKDWMRTKNTLQANWSRSSFLQAGCRIFEEQYPKVSLRRTGKQRGRRCRWVHGLGIRNSARNYFLYGSFFSLLEKVYSIQLKQREPMYSKHRNLLSRQQFGKVFGSEVKGINASLIFLFFHILLNQWVVLYVSGLTEDKLPHEIL